MRLKGHTVYTVTRGIIQSDRNFVCWHKEFIVVHVDM